MIRRLLLAVSLLPVLASAQPAPVTHEIANPAYRAGMDCSRYGCALTSLQFRGFENINNYDRGRQGQVALQLDDYGECWNPTQAGSSIDGPGPRSSSVPLGAWTNGIEMAASTRAAYWSVNGVGVCPKGTYPGANPANVLSNTYIDTRYTTSPALWRGIPNHLALQVQVSIRAEDTRRRIEAYTLYLNPEFSWMYRLRPDGTAWQPDWRSLAWGFQAWGLTGDINDPVIMSTPDKDRAVALVRAPGTERACESGHENFGGHFPAGGSGTFAKGGSKISVALTAGPACGTGTQSFTLIIFIGDFNQVLDNLRYYTNRIPSTN